MMVSVQKKNAILIFLIAVGGVFGANAQIWVKVVEQ